MDLQTNEIDELWQMLRSLYKRNEASSLDSEDKDDKQDLGEKEEDMERFYQELCAARTDYAKLDKNQKSSKVTKPSVTAHAKTTEQLKMKRLDTPTFTGKIRDYPSFKNDFKNHVVAAYGEDPFALKGCLWRCVIYCERC